MGPIKVSARADLEKGIIRRRRDPMLLVEYSPVDTFMVAVGSEGRCGRRGGKTCARSRSSGLTWLPRLDRHLRDIAPHSGLHIRGKRSKKAWGP